MSIDLLFDNARLQGRVITLEALLESEKAENARLRKGDDRDMTTAYLYGAEQYKAENARLKSEVERLTEIIDSFKTMPIIEGQSFDGWKLDEHHRLVSLVESLRAGSIEGAKQFTHKEYREFQKTMIEKNDSKGGNIVETKSPGFIEDLGNGVEKHDLKFRVQPTAKEGNAQS